jgi:hypothetical protein
MAASDTFDKKTTQERFLKIMGGAMHKPTPLNDIPKKSKKKAVKPSSSRSSRASG